MYLHVLTPVCEFQLFLILMIHFSAYFSNFKLNYKSYYFPLHMRKIIIDVPDGSALICSLVQHTSQFNMKLNIICTLCRQYSSFDICYVTICFVDYLYSFSVHNVHEIPSNQNSFENLTERYALPIIILNLTKLFFMLNFYFYVVGNNVHLYISKQSID